jgi:hypothetical protein
MFINVLVEHAGSIFMVEESFKVEAAYSPRTSVSDYMEFHPSR